VAVEGGRGVDPDALTHMSEGKNSVKTKEVGNDLSESSDRANTKADVASLERPQWKKSKLASENFRPAFI